MGMSFFRSPTHCRVLCFQVYWADQLSSLWVVDSCPNFAVEPWPSSIIFISMGGHREPHQELALHLGDRDFHSRRREAYKIRISASPVHHCRFKIWPPSRPVRATSEFVDQTGRERQPSEPERSRSRSRRRSRRHNHRRHDEGPDQTARPMSAPAEPRPVHTFSPPAHRSASAGHMPPCSQSGCKSRKAPRTMAAFLFTAPSQRRVLPRFRPPPLKSKSRHPKQQV